MSSSPHPMDPNYESECKRQGIKPKKRSVGETQQDGTEKKPSPKTTTRK